MEEQTTSNDHGTSNPADPRVTQGSNKRRIAQALNSRIRKKMGNIISNRSKNEEWLRAVPECPVYRPTLEEFQDPLGYIEKVQSEAQKWGICKIIPPVSPAVPGGMVCRELNGDSLKFTTRSQPVRERVWVDMDERKFNQTDTFYTLQQYCKLAEDFQRKLFFASGSYPALMIESEYWRQRNITSDLTVEYGNDVEGTAFCSPGEGDPLGDTDWNLQVLPRLENSTLRLLKGEVPGITTPMLYIGMLYATFAWHVEDHYLYSINYQHLGAAKTWYGVPGCAADAFEEVAQKQVYARALQAEGKRGRDACDGAHKAILGKTTMFCPKLLLDANVRVCRAVQQPGEFIVTFPRAYHAGFSNGFCVGEAVNFAMHDWYQFGQDCSLRYRRLKQPPILPHDELVCEEAMLLKERLMSGVAASSSAKPAADVSLAGTFVTLLRQENLQRRCLVLQRKLTQRPMPTTSCDGMQTNDCSNCGHLCFLAMVMAKDKEEQRCMDCAMFDNVMGPDNKLFCHPKLDQYEECARWFEQQPLLRGADWVGSSRDRGLTESKLHHAGWGHPNSRTVPAPNQVFVWESLPSATSCAEPETTTPELNIVQGVLGSDQAGHVALDQNTHSLDVSKLVLHPCAIDQVISQLAQGTFTRLPCAFDGIFDYPSSQASCSQVPVGGAHAIQWPCQQGSLGVLVDPAACVEPPQLAIECRAHGSAVSDSNVSVDVVNVSVARNALGDSSDSADISCATKEPTPTSTLESGAALAPRLPPRDAGASRPQPIMPASHMAGQPRDAVADRGQPSATNADMAAEPSMMQMGYQPTTGLPVAEQSTAPGGEDERPMRGDEQSSSTNGESSGTGLPVTMVDPGPPAKEQADAKKTAVTPNHPPRKAAAVPRNGQAAKATPASTKTAPKKTKKTPNRAPSKVDAARGTDIPAKGTDIPAKAAAASGKKAGASGKEPEKPAAWKLPKEVSEAAKKFYSGPGGLVRLLRSDSVKVGGQEMSRQVYCLESDPSQRFMRIRDVAKAGDHLKSSAESARDVTRKLWVQAAAKAREVAAAGGSAPKQPPYPRHYTCKEEASIATSFLIGMEEVARIVHWVSDSRQRRLLKKYCSSVWPGLKQCCADESDEAKDGCTKKVEAGSKAAKGGKGNQGKQGGRNTRQKRAVDTLIPETEVIALSRRDYALLAQDALLGTAHHEAVSKFLAKRQRIK